jgi:PAS domain S-box-containing protein
MPESLENMLRTERRLAAMVETTTDAILILDHEQKITLANQAAERLFGYSQERLLHQPIEMLIPPRFHRAHHHHVEGFGKTGTSVRRMGGEANVVGMRADGTEFPIDASISHLLEDGKPLYTVILRDITERKRAEQELRLSREYLRNLYDNLQTIREEERKRIARELHDDLGQTLGAVRIDLTLLRNTLPANLPELEKNAELIDKLLLSAITSVRRISSDLRPRPLDDLGLVPALQMLAGEFSQRHNIVCEVGAPTEDVRLPDDIASPVFRMVQESLNNVAKHADATHVHIELSMNENILSLTIADNGKGFTAADTKKPESFGLIGMRERAWAMGGSLEVNSGATGDSKGTTINISIPLTGNADDAADISPQSANHQHGNF